MGNAERESLSRREQLLRDLDNVEYRKAFVEALVKDTVAFQLRGLRKEEDLEQRDVARRLGNANLQPMISRYENPDYGRYSISTLLDLAAAFDVALVVRFASFSELLEWDWASNAGVLTPASYPRDGRLAQVAEQLHKENCIAVNQDSPVIKFGNYQFKERDQDADRFARESKHDLTQGRDFLSSLPPRPEKTAARVTR